MRYAANDNNARAVLARNLRALIEARGMTQLDLANAVGLNPNSVRAYCTGVRYPRAEQLQKIAEYFGVPMGVLTEPGQGKPEGARGVSDEGYRVALMYDQLDYSNRKAVEAVIRALLQDQMMNQVPREYNLVLG